MNTPPIPPGIRMIRGFKKEFQKIKCALGIHSPWSPPWMYPRDVVCKWCQELLITTEETERIVKQEENERNRKAVKLLNDLVAQTKAQRIFERYGIRT